MNLGKLGVWYFTENMPATAAAETAARIESLGYSALWIPETVGRHPLVHAAWLLAHTKTLNIATGIASIYNREPGVTVAAQHTPSNPVIGSCWAWESRTCLWLKACVV